MAFDQHGVDTSAIVPFETRGVERVDSIFAAEASDWFWWFGEDQESGNDEEFDDLFRRHLRNVYSAIGVDPPSELDRHIVPHAALWTFTDPITRVQRTDRLTVRTNCPGALTWRIDDREPESRALAPAGGVMAGSHRFYITLGPFPDQARELRFRFHCAHPGCAGDDVCCSPGDHIVELW